MEKDCLIINIISIVNFKKHRFVFFVSYEKTRNVVWEYTFLGFFERNIKKQVNKNLINSCIDNYYDIKYPKLYHIKMDSYYKLEYYQIINQIRSLIALGLRTDYVDVEIKKYNIKKKLNK